MAKLHTGFYPRSYKYNDYYLSQHLCLHPIYQNLLRLRTISVALASSNLKRFGGESWRRKIRFLQKCVSDFLLFPDANQLIDLLITFSETKISKFGIFFFCSKLTKQAFVFFQEVESYFQNKTC